MRPMDHMDYEYEDVKFNVDDYPKPQPKPIEVVIPPPPENLDEALEFLKGLT